MAHAYPLAKTRSSSAVSELSHYSEEEVGAPAETDFLVERARVATNGRPRRTGRRTTLDEGSLDQYLRDISAYSLITREEEVELAKAIRRGDQNALDALVRSN
ncbi:MAG TPA: sigma-70 factor domain-containing protein, partial [Candidatus Paceibacterota bacterium]|nr:sigma-70 factor domain-containing protein [Candidatus Paceibacterota bacterium]